MQPSYLSLTFFQSPSGYAADRGRLRVLVLAVWVSISIVNSRSGALNGRKERKSLKFTSRSGTADSNLATDRT